MKVTDLSRPLRWVIAMGAALAAAFAMALFGEALPFGEDTMGAMLRGLMIGGVTIAAMRLMRLGKWDEADRDDA